MWKITKIQLNDDQRKQVEDFYEKSDRYVRLLCFQMQLLPKITKEDLYGKAYERLCIYAQRHKLNVYGYSKLARFIVLSSRNMLFDKYCKHTLIVDDRIENDDTNSFIEENAETSVNECEKLFEQEYIDKMKDSLFSCLTSNERKFMEEIYINNLNQAEIAEKYGCTPQNVSWTIMNARKKIQKIWKYQSTVR